MTKKFRIGDDVIIWDSKGRPHFETVAHVEDDTVYVHGIPFNQDGTSKTGGPVRIEHETAKNRKDAR